MTIIKMTAAQVARKVIENQPLFILDVRNTELMKTGELKDPALII
ncbi:hypothetical protein BAOM_2727 [Peribacillus asahii]|uniref:Rhodanese domain-containing protein n=1 Tax=Peribacillus asahii TaxID=228899 RepID=A0A3T0KSG0_9BACI|nr:hypothetical protein BAOM_2727 [Peribacillus asahii]